MFTGIVEKMGIVKQIQRGAQVRELTIEAPQLLEDSSVGDSIAVNGACLTMTRVVYDNFTADVSAETLRCTTLGGFNPGDPVNLELPLRLNDRLGGHLVLGHVDEIGTISGWHDEATSSLMRVSISTDAMRYVICKGSICIDGISLTIANLYDDSFEVALIPHTKQVTTLGNKGIGDPVNIEVDLLGRYVEQLLTHQPTKETSINLAFLKEHGYLT